jgi:hypothetical protein
MQKLLGFKGLVCTSVNPCLVRTVCFVFKIMWQEAIYYEKSKQVNLFAFHSIVIAM